FLLALLNANNISSVLLRLMSSDNACLISIIDDQVILSRITMIGTNETGLQIISESLLHQAENCYTLYQIYFRDGIWRHIVNKKVRPKVPLEKSQGSVPKKLPGASTVSKDNLSVKSQIGVPSTSSSDQISKSNKSRLLISILPEDLEEKRKHIIGLVLERFPYLSLRYSKSYGDRFVFNSSVPCPICNKDHEGENIKNDIKGGWGSGMYFGETGLLP
ncbi:13167_t:CDS:2, partial [Funneliformis mosseae]